MLSCLCNLWREDQNAHSLKLKLPHIWIGKTTQKKRVLTRALLPKAVMSILSVFAAVLLSFGVKLNSVDVFVGTLPPDFLRITAVSQQQQEAADQQAALALQQQLVGVPYAHGAAGRLSITVAQAKLVKNYGMTRMDPYVRLRVGHCVYETHTDPNGGKNPRWNKVVQCLLPQGVTSIYLEIYDECSFTMDELIAWAHIPISQAVLNGETHEDWFPLSGKQGEGVEGMINLVLSYSLAPAQPSYALYPSVGPVVMVPTPVYGMRPSYAPVSVYTAPPAQPAQPIQPPQLSEQELKQIEEMFPNMDKEVIKSVFEANRGNKDGTVNSLLQMCE